MRTRIFLDFWNFQLNWNKRFGTLGKVDWPKVSHVLIRESQRVISSAGITTAVLYEETRVYASYNPEEAKDRKLKGWLKSWLNRQPGYVVFVRERKARQKPVHCRSCGEDTHNCPHCGKPFVRAGEKGVDTAMCTDLLSLAWENAYDVAILVSSDADFVPAIQRLQEKKFKIINAAWDKAGFDLAQTCWASITLDSLATQLAAPPTP